ncbi:MAG: hypothetical protein EB060_02120 [Proteobacteria bacterium]|nr:hypothetical protein [Pseudomonadota bacterium]
MDADFSDPAIFDSFILHDTASGVVSSIAKQFAEAGQKSFTITGPYGGGKSTLAVLLSALYSPVEDIRNAAEKLLGKKELNQLRSLVPLGKKGWVTIRLVGSKSDLLSAFKESIEIALNEYWPTRKPDAVSAYKQIKDEKALLQFLLALAKEANAHGSGLLVMIDEMGKLLEHCASTKQDIHFFQDMAESFARSKSPCLFLGILHQSFQEYAKDLTAATKEEWSKIQGRFVDIPFSVSVEEVVGLVETAIDGPPPPPVANKLAKSVSAALKGGRFAAVKNLHEELALCWPLHPVTALLLGPLSRRRFSQNERSIFGFLTSVEPFGFREFLLSHESAGEGYTPDMLWDFLKHNLEPAILVSPDGHRWAEAADAVDRANSYGDLTYTRLVKTISLLDLFGRPFSIKPDKALLCSTFENVPQKEMSAALNLLEKNSIIVFRKHLDSWAIFAGSDIDLDAEVSIIKDKLAGNVSNWDIISQKLRPVVAKRYYHSTGSLRWFERKIEYFSNIKSLHSVNAPVHFVLALNHKDSSIEIDVQAVSKTSGHIVGYSPQASRITPLAAELSALEEAGRSLAGLAGDKVARRELSGRVDVVRNKLSNVIEEAFDTAQWYYKGKLYSTDNANLSQIASKVAEKIYPKTPTIKNELINRDRPSGNAVAARRILLYKMVKDGGREKLGIEGSPPELSLYLNLLSATGIHRYDSALKTWVFNKPEDSSFVALWEKAEQLLNDASHNGVSFASIYQAWLSAPFGLKEGVLPILALSFVMTFEEEIALYFEGQYTPVIDDLYIDRLLQNPGGVSIRRFDVKGVKRSVISKLADFVAEELDTKKADNALDIAKPLAQFVHGLRPWVKRTKGLDPQTVAVRDAILLANDPYKLLFEELPRICGIEQASLSSASGAEQLVNVLTHAVSELKACYDTLLDDVKANIFKAIGIEENSPESLALLKKRCEIVVGTSGDFRLDAFARRLSAADTGNKWMEGIASLATNKPSREWTDSDIDKANLELFELAKRFCRVELYAQTKKKQPGAMALTMFIEEGATVAEYSKSVYLNGSSHKYNELVVDKVRRAIEDVCEDSNVRALVIAELLKDLMELQKHSKQEEFVEPEPPIGRYAHERN